MHNKSPSGSLCPYYFMGGELHPLHYGNYNNDKNKLFEIIEKEEIFILNSSGINNRRIWIDLYGTVIDNDVIDILANHLKSIKHKINKVCLVGCSSNVRRKIKNKLKLENMDLLNQIKYFTNPEKAKIWLIGKMDKLENNFE